MAAAAGRPVVTRGSRILVVEDDETLRETLGEVMAEDGHEVRMAEDGQRALDEMMSWDPDIVVLDLMMPKMNAYQLRHAQRRDGTASRAQVLVLSAVPDIETAAAELNADAWLAKPFRLDELVAVLDDLIDRRRA
jgi:DNA-binding response OmpR family regulator